MFKNFHIVVKFLHLTLSFPLRHIWTWPAV